MASISSSGKSEVRLWQNRELRRIVPGCASRLGKQKKSQKGSGIFWQATLNFALTLNRDGLATSVEFSCRYAKKRGLFFFGPLVIFQRHSLAKITGTHSLHQVAANRAAG
jgi:hypothetical protein